MMRASLVWAALCAALSVQADDESLRVLPKTIDGVAPRDMMHVYLLGEIDAAWRDWQDAFEVRQTAEAIRAYQAPMRAKLLRALGEFPERCPLNPRVVGSMGREGYLAEKILFESAPSLYVSALLFLPDAERFEPPYPGVLIPCGHAESAKGYETYQSMGASLAYHGMAALVFDPVDQGERFQLLKEDGSNLMWGTRAHTMAAVGSILLGAQYQYLRGLGWDAGHRLPAIAAGGGSRAHRMHRQ